MKDPTRFIVLADAHLRGRDDPNQEAMVRFLDDQALAGTGLIVLGDLFDFLAGRNRVAEHAYQPVLERLARYSPFHYLEGNHDFDLSARIGGLEQATIHPRPVSLHLGERRYYLMHGDRCHPHDVGTRLLRSVLQSMPVRLVRDRVLPADLAFRFGLGFATTSRNRQWPGRRDEETYLVRTAARVLQMHAVHAVLFAHSHRARLQQTADGILANPGTATPGGQYLELMDDALRLRLFPTGELLDELRQDPNASSRHQR